MAYPNFLNKYSSQARIISVTTLLYFMSGSLIFLSPWLQQYVNAVWPPAGIGLGAVLLWGNVALPGIYLADFALHHELFAHTDSVAQKGVCLLLALVPVMQAWLGSLLVKRFADYPNDLVSLRAVLLFLFLSGPVTASLTSALKIELMAYFGGSESGDLRFDYFSTILAQTMGIAVFTPLFFVIFNRSERIWRQRFLPFGLPVVAFFVLISMAYFYSQNRELDRLNKMISLEAQDIKAGLEDESKRHGVILDRLQGIFRQSGGNEAFLRLNTQPDFRLHADLMQIQWFRAVKTAQGTVYDNVFEETRKGQARQSEFDSIGGLLGQLDLTSGMQTILGKRQYIQMLPFIASGAGTCNCIENVVVGLFDLDQSLVEVMERGNHQNIGVIIGKKINAEDTRSVYGFTEVGLNAYPLDFARLETFNFGNGRAVLQVMPSQQFLADFYSRSPWLLLVGGMFLTAFLSIGLLVSTGHTEFVASQVERRTKELHRSNQKLAASERQFRQLVETQSAIVWRADPVTFKFLYVSSEAATILGYPIKQWQTEPDFWQNHLHPQDRESVMDYFKRHQNVAKSRSLDLEYRMIAADNRTVWLRDISTLVVESGVIVELYGFMIDITLQKHAEEQLRLAASTFESLQGIMITDKDGNILRVNKAFTHITGYSAQQVIGKNPRILQSGRHDKAFYENYWRELLTKDKVEGEIYNRKRNGVIYPEWQTVTAVRTDKGEISHFVSVFSDITEKKEAETKIHNMAFFDALTNLPNRRLLLDRFDQEIAIARRHHQFGAVLYLDLDHFKVLNDSQGHKVGDELLIQVASRLSSVLREEDTPARLGGDEFVVLLHANSESLASAADHAMIVAEKIREQLNTPFVLGQYQHQIGTSIGVALFPEGNENPDLLLQQADTAMYRSKSGGRNAISFFQRSMQEAADLRLNLEQDLRQALEQNRFMLRYHPQTDANGKLVGVEALIRWEDKAKGLLSPAEFIPVAEESNLILNIGKWVLKEACSQIRQWQDQGYASLPFLSVNLSPKQFRQQDFVAQVKAAIESAGISPHSLSIELTESAMILDTQDTIGKMNALKQLGVSVAVDDFGTGYSSLVHLKQLPLDVLKIDKTFVRDVLTDANDAIIVETIISMAKHLNIQVVAEGVETAEQLKFLKEKGCGLFQGHYFSHPLTAQNFANTYLSKPAISQTVNS